MPDFSMVGLLSGFRRDYTTFRTGTQEVRRQVFCWYFAAGCAILRKNDGRSVPHGTD
nr:MAG TPA: hypothetical protein [Caudoviricetes sp.]